ncbi:MAG: type II toxin-antitoxin system VapB family antitoxin [Deltaproteobacteria bacterium]|jgi:Arc/MetJ family transcription regulator|nr:type II toxin-antitoxin system VapB family antitoxin [Deltaproteobacteria bacterium]
MKTLVDIDETFLKEAMIVSGASSKKETIILALEELIKSRLRQQLKSKRGSGILRMNLSDLRKIRQRRQKAHKIL